MSNQRILVISGILPALLRQLVAHNEVIEIKRCASTIRPLNIAEISAESRSERQQESWQEKPNRRAGFASARRQAKKNRRKHG